MLTSMRQTRGIGRLRERLVLGHVRPLLSDGEDVEAWAHVLVGDRQGVLALTSTRCFVHWSGGEEQAFVAVWGDVRAWEIDATDPAGTVVTFETALDRVGVGLPLSSKARARKASTVLRTVERLAPSTARKRGSVREAGLELPAEPRGLRGLTRRVGVGLLGALLILVGLVFASPFVPGPGALTVLAGLALLASEYDWARDAHHWLGRTLERLLARMRTWRRRRREQRLGRRQSQPREARREPRVLPTRQVPSTTAEASEPERISGKHPRSA